MPQNRDFDADRNAAELQAAKEIRNIIEYEMNTRFVTHSVTVRDGVAVFNIEDQQKGEVFLVMVTRDDNLSR